MNPTPRATSRPLRPAHPGAGATRARWCAALAACAALLGGAPPAAASEALSPPWSTSPEEPATDPVGSGYALDPVTVPPEIPPGVPAPPPQPAPGPIGDIDVRDVGVDVAGGEAAADPALPGLVPPGEANAALDALTAALALYVVLFLLARLARPTAPRPVAPFG